MYWPPELPPADDQVRLRGVHGALLAALQLDAQMQAERPTAPERDIAAYDAVGLADVLRTFIDLALNMRAGSVQCRLRSVCGLSHAEETALRRLTQRLGGGDDARRPQSGLGLHFAAQERRAAADAARHGLRRCALPSCDAQEPHPKLFKLCSRCQATAYCCKQHQAEDWKRHKREDGCKPADD